jgi:hypothetical protein
MTDEEKEKLFELIGLILDDLSLISSQILPLYTHQVDLNIKKERKLLEELKNPEPEDY